ncbi:MAG TPA: aspartate kinase [Candidatus Bathyarchaeia archaeon]|nr:aspartate kinase [Candidatus Bathyarchaeia archaeon]
MRVIMKFGGSSIGDDQGISHAITIINNFTKKGDQILVVVSALPKITDELINISEKAVEGNLKPITEFMDSVRELHAQMARGCIHDSRLLSEVMDELDQTSRELEEILHSVAKLMELTPRSRDFILSFGEKMSAPLICGAVKDSGLKARWLTGCEAGITTDENFGEAKPLMDLTSRRVKEQLEPLLMAGTIPIVAGYGACSPHGTTTTLGRGGSDYTATLLGAAIDADEVVIWKEVDGLMTADPKIEPNAKVLDRISYAEASEMAYFGAKAIHPKALEPVSEKQIPVRIRSSNDLTTNGTLIAGEGVVRSEGVVKAVTCIDKVGMISVAGAGMSGLAGIASRVFNVLSESGINVLMISQSSSETGISFVTPRDKLRRATNVLELTTLGAEYVKNVTAEDDVCVIAAVGAGMRGTPGVAARVFKAVAEKGVNVRMIAQGSSELNISFVVPEGQGPTAVRALHEEFELAKFAQANK